MTPRDFCYWLQGYFEIHGESGPLTSDQTEMIQRHLSLVFQHSIDPAAGGPEVQAQLNAIHNSPLAGRPPGVRC